MTRRILTLFCLIRGRRIIISKLCARIRDEYSNRGWNPSVRAKSKEQTRTTKKHEASERLTVRLNYDWNVIGQMIFERIDRALTFLQLRSYLT